MGKWKAYFQFNMEESSAFPCVEFEVPDDLFEAISKAVKEEKLLKECDFYQRLKDLAEDSADIHELIPFEEEEEPVRDDYDDEEEYQDALEEYNEAQDNFYECVCEESLDIYDPTEYLRFRRHFIGRVFPDYAGEDNHLGEFQIGCCSERVDETTVKILFDKSGKILEVADIYSEALESEDVRSSSWSECYPQFDEIIEELEDVLGEDAFLK